MTTSRFASSYTEASWESLPSCFVAPSTANMSLLKHQLAAASLPSFLLLTYILNPSATSADVKNSAILIIMAANAAFSTPIATSTNMLVQEPGNYCGFRLFFSDSVKAAVLDDGRPPEALVLTKLVEESRLQVRHTFFLRFLFSLWCMVYEPSPCVYLGGCRGNDSRPYAKKP